MIEYQKGYYLYNIVFHAHGSALYRGMVPGILSLIVFVCLDRFWDKDYDDREIGHPYVVGVLVSSVSFLIIFRANFGYQRYWEATSATHHCLSKWLDGVTQTGVFHMQCSHYDSIKPPAFYDNFDLDRCFLNRDREHSSDFSTTTKAQETKSRSVVRSIEFVENVKRRASAFRAREDVESSGREEGNNNNGNPPAPKLKTTKSAGHREMSRLTGAKSRLDGGWGLLFADDPDGPTATFYDPDDEDNFLNESIIPEGFASTKGGRTPSLFLQELAHLASLMVAVAFSTLRNDIEGAASPLGIYEPGAPWPPADPDKIPRKKDGGFEIIPHWLVKMIRYGLFLDKGTHARTKYNTRRPMLVIGGVSDNEIAFLQKAKGASAKTQLAYSWLSEFVIREQIKGSLGKVAPPIVSRIFQFLSDGMIFYNHARKIMFVPFPFPHAQLSVFFIMTLVGTIPFLMDQYLKGTWSGAILTFLTVTCLAGLHEVARELENPFRNAPNDIPLVTMLAFFNESVITMFSGFHPDFYWDPKKMKCENNVDGKNNGANGTKKAGEPGSNAVQSEETIKELRELVAKQSAQIEQLMKALNGKIADDEDVANSSSEERGKSVKFS